MIPQTLSRHLCIMLIRAITLDQMAMTLCREIPECLNDQQYMAAKYTDCHNRE